MDVIQEAKEYLAQNSSLKVMAQNNNSDFDAYDTEVDLISRLVDRLEWKPISECPWGKRVLMWWIPVDDNKYAEAAIICQLVHYDKDGKEDDIYADGYRPHRVIADNGMWYEIERVKGWLPLPPIGDK